MNKILLVDDDRELTSLLKELLEMEGFNVIVAHDGEQALDLLDDSIDLLLLDVMMPKKNGIEGLEELIKIKFCIRYKSGKGLVKRILKIS